MGQCFAKNAELNDAAAEEGSVRRGHQRKKSISDIFGKSPKNPAEEISETSVASKKKTLELRDDVNPVVSFSPIVIQPPKKLPSEIERTDGSESRLGEKPSPSSQGPQSIRSNKNNPGIAASILSGQPPANKGVRRRSMESERLDAALQPLMDKKFGYEKNIGSKFDLEQEIGRGHFGHTCVAKVKKGVDKGKSVAVKIIPKAKMTTAVAVMDVKKEVQILKALGSSGHAVQFLGSYEDPLNVYIAMELCEGGELLERLLQRGGRYPEKDVIRIVSQILTIVSFCHLQGIVHRDLKPENFLFLTKESSSPLRVIDFGLSDFVKPEERLNDIVGSAYYIAPEVLHRSYSVEADVWSVGVIAYILLCGSRPFWARTESGIFRGVLKLDPSFADQPWPHVSPAAKDFVKSLLSKDWRQRPTAPQALTHSWVRGGVPVPLDIAVYKGLPTYLSHLPVRKAALRALVKTLAEDELVYLRSQFSHIDLDEDGKISKEDLSIALKRVSTSAMEISGTLKILDKITPEMVGLLEFSEFCAAVINVFQMEALSNWSERAQLGYDFFCEASHTEITSDDILMGIKVVDPQPVLKEWLNQDGTLSFLGFTRLVHGRSRNKGKKRNPAKISLVNTDGIPLGESPCNSPHV